MPQIGAANAHLCTYLKVIKYCLLMIILIPHNPSGMTMIASNVETHALSSVYVAIEIAISQAPIRFLHFYQPIVFAILYGLFSFFYYLAGGTDHEGMPIYPVTDWGNDSRSALTTIASIALFCLILHVSIQRKL